MRPYEHTEQERVPMSQKTPKPVHDPVPKYQHTRRVHHETDNIMLVHYLPADEYGFTRLIHFTNDGNSTGYIDIDNKQSRAFDDLTQLGADHVLFHAGNTVYHHNDRVRRLVKKDLTSFEIAQQVKAEKEALAEAAKPKVLSFDEEREARNYRATACKEADYKVKQTDERLRRLHHWQARASGYKQQVDDLTALGGDQSLIDSQQAQYERFQALCDTNRDEYHANHEKAVAEAKAAYAKTAREYYEEAHTNA